MDTPAAASFFASNGYVIIEDAINPDHIATLREVMLNDVTKILARTDTPYNFNKGNKIGRAHV